MSKKNELLTNAANIIYEEGIQKLTIEYVAEKSNLTKGGVLYHFDTKANLLYEMNKMAIHKFESLWETYRSQLSGSAVFTRSYALATLDFFNNREKALLPAVFISSLEDERSFMFWKETSNKWEQLFQQDSGNPSSNLTLRLMCDGIWFSILYATSPTIDEEMAAVVVRVCQSLEKEQI